MKKVLYLFFALVLLLSFSVTAFANDYDLGYEEGYEQGFEDGLEEYHAIKEDEESDEVITAFFSKVSSLSTQHYHIKLLSFITQAMFLMSIAYLFLPGLVASGKPERSHVLSDLFCFSISLALNTLMLLILSVSYIEATPSFYEVFVFSLLYEIGFSLIIFFVIGLLIDINARWFKPYYVSRYFFSAIYLIVIIFGGHKFYPSIVSIIFQFIIILIPCIYSRYKYQKWYKENFPYIV